MTFLERCAEMVALCETDEPPSEENRRQHKELVAREYARYAQRQASSPQLPLGAY